MANPTIAQLAADLAAGRTTSIKLTEEAFARIDDAKGEGKRAFVKTWRAQALAAAQASVAEAEESWLALAAEAEDLGLTP